METWFIQDQYNGSKWLTFFHILFSIFLYVNDSKVLVWDDVKLVLWFLVISALLLFVVKKIKLFSTSYRTEIPIIFWTFPNLKSQCDKFLASMIKEKIILKFLTGIYFPFTGKKAENMIIWLSCLCSMIHRVSLSRFLISPDLIFEMSCQLRAILKLIS